MVHKLGRPSPWLLDGTYYRTLPAGARHSQVPEPVGSCIVSLHVEGDGDEGSGTDRRDLVGMAFAVSLDEGKGRKFTYLVSTREVVRRSIRRGRIFLRFRLTNGGAQDVATVPYDDWYPHPDPRTDLAAHPLLEVPSDADLTPVPLAMVLTDEETKARQVGAGDELLSAGQFEPHPGDSGPRPVVSIGNVYLMPQLVATRLLGPDSSPIEVEGYLAEWLYWGGASGSPVFRYSPGETGPVDAVALLGVVHSHVDADDPLAMGEVLVDGDAHGEREIAVVVPAQGVRDILETGPLAQAREEAIERLMIEAIELERNRTLDELALTEPAR